MKVAFKPEIEMSIRRAVKPGNFWALDELIAEICEKDPSLRGQCSVIVIDEYHRRLSMMPRQEMRELYRRCYKEESDANKDWLLGEIVESIEAEQN